MLKKTISAMALIIGLTGFNTAHADAGLVSFKQLSLDTALELAHTTLKNCRENGYQVAVAVVDPG